MSQNYPVEVRNVGKYFKKHTHGKSYTLQETIIKGFKNTWKTTPFWALRNISFSIRPGEMVGVIGHNGAGKSTLLRLVGGLGRPSEGKIHTSGRMGALLSLGAGFHPELTGRENLFVNGVISGLRYNEVTRKLDSIIDFAELEPFIDSPLHTYSSGMQMRLAFSIAAHISPEILLIDEVLAVGDAKFKQKCLHKIKQFKKDGCAVLFVGHQLEFIANNCDQALWLANGQIQGKGDPKKIIAAYKTSMAADSTPLLHKTGSITSNVPDSG